jgi:hemolysin D
MSPQHDKALTRQAAIVPIRRARPLRRRRDELEFLPAALEIMETPPSPTARISAVVIVALMAAGIIWATIGRIDIDATADGSVVPSGRTKTVQPFATGVVTAIHVANGQHVQAGEAVVDLDPTQSMKDRDKATHEVLLARLDEVRLQAQLEDRPAVWPAGVADADALATAKSRMREQTSQQAAKLATIDRQIAEKRANVDEVKATIADMDATMPMVAAHFRIRSWGVQTGSGDMLDYQDSLRTLVDQHQQRLIQLQKQQEAEQSLASLIAQRDETVAEYRSSLLDNLNQAQDQDAKSTHDMIWAARLTDLQTLRAPVSGLVQQLAVHTLGGVVMSGDPIMVIVPDDAPLEVEAMVQNRDIGFVHPGQPAEVKVEAMDFTRYGMLHGTVTGISHDVISDNQQYMTLQPQGGQNYSGQQSQSHAHAQQPDGSQQGHDDPVYVAHIALREKGIQTEEGFMPVQAGMTVVTEIKTGRRRIIDFLLSPLQRYRHEALTER